MPANVERVHPPKGPGVAWGMVHCQSNRLVGGESWNPSFFHETIIKPLALMEIVILQIEALQSRVMPKSSVPPRERFRAATTSRPNRPGPPAFV